MLQLLNFNISYFQSLTIKWTSRLCLLVWYSINILQNNLLPRPWPHVCGYLTYRSRKCNGYRESVPKTFFQLVLWVRHWGLLQWRCFPVISIMIMILPRHTTMMRGSDHTFPTMKLVNQIMKTLEFPVHPSASVQPLHAGQWWIRGIPLRNFKEKISLYARRMVIIITLVQE